jgi:hypothetical protein
MKAKLLMGVKSLRLEKSKPLLAPSSKLKSLRRLKI